MSEQSTYQQAVTIITIVTAYPQFVTPAMHAGIDLARVLVHNEKPLVTESAVVDAMIADTYRQLTAAAAQRFYDEQRGQQRSGPQV